MPLHLSVGFYLCAVSARRNSENAPTLRFSVLIIAHFGVGRNLFKQSKFFTNVSVGFLHAFLHLKAFPAILQATPFQ